MNELAVLTEGWIKEDCVHQNGPKPDGTYGVWVWNGDENVSVGDSYGGAKVLQILEQFNLKEVQTLDRGYKGYLTFDRIPGIIISKDQTEGS